VAIEREHIKAYVPIADLTQRTPFFRQEDFLYDAKLDVYVCPAGKELHFWRADKPPNALDGTAHGPKTAITVHSKHSVPPVPKAAASAAVWLRRYWIE
jgi:hypothetical protein